MESVRKLLRRFKQKDLKVITDNWSAFHTRHINTTALARLKTKTKFVNAVLKLLQSQPVTKHELAELDLLYVSERSFAKKWTCYKLTEMAGCPVACVAIGLTTDEIEQRIRSEFKTFKLHNEVCVLNRCGAYWLRVAVSETRFKAFNVNGGTYIVVYSGVPFLCIANMKPKFANFISQVLVATLKCSALEKMELEGRCIRSLLQIVLKQHSQVIPSSLQSNAVVSAPNRKRKKMTSEAGSQSVEERDDRIHDEHWREKRRCKEYVSSQFGDGRQPTLEFLEYRLETKCAGTAYVPNMSNTEPFHCSVRFEGSNVLEGLTQLVTAGLACLPLPNHLGNIKSLARNKVRLRSKATNG